MDTRAFVWQADRGGTPLRVISLSLQGAAAHQGKRERERESLLGNNVHSEQTCCLHHRLFTLLLPQRDEGPGQRGVCIDVIRHANRPPQ